MSKKMRLLYPLFIIVLLISACNMPSANTNQNISGTTAAQTVQAMLSATPVLVPMSITSTPPFPIPPTLTSIPLVISTITPAASATPRCNIARFITDVTIPDGTVMTPGQKFTKKWRIKNDGDCAWNGFTLVFDSGDAMSAAASNALAPLNPGQEIDISLDMTAPIVPGLYRGYWRVVTNGGVSVPIVGGYQNKSFYVDIKVQTVTPTFTPTNTSTPFAVTSLMFVNSGICGNFTATINITTNAPGTVTYQWKFDDATLIVPVESLIFAAAGTQSDSYTWTTVTPGTHWIDVYVDNPNHQNFGRASFTCP